MQLVRISGAVFSLIIALAVLSPGRAAAEEPVPAIKVDVLQKGSSAGKTFEQALADLPLKHLNREQRRRVDDVLQNRSLFRRLPTIGMNSEPELYDYFIRNPEAAVGIWRVLEISHFKLAPAGPNLWKGDAGDGSQGTIEVLYRTPSQQLLLCEGEYKCPVLPKPIRARSLMHLRTDFADAEKSDNRIVHDLDLFVTFPSQTVDTVVKVIAPVSNTIADKNFRELSLFVQFMSVAMHKQPGWVEHVIQRLEGVTPQQKEELMKVSARVFVTARKTELQRDGMATASVEEILVPFRDPGKQPADGAP